MLEACIESASKLTGYSWHARLIQLFHFVRHRYGLGGSDGVTTSIAVVHGAQHHCQCYGACGVWLRVRTGLKCGCQRSASEGVVD